MQDVNKYFKFCDTFQCQAAGLSPTQGWGSRLCITWPPFCLCPTLFCYSITKDSPPFSHEQQVSFKLPESFWGKKTSLRVNPNQILPAQMPVITGETRAQSSAWLLWAVSVTKGNPRAYPAQFSTSQYWQAQQFLIGTLRSSIENETKLMQVSQRELQQGRPELKDIHSPLTVESFPRHFGFWNFASLPYLAIYTVNK